MKASQFLQAVLSRFPVLPLRDLFMPALCFWGDLRQGLGFAESQR